MLRYYLDVEVTYMKKQYTENLVEKRRKKGENP